MPDLAYPNYLTVGADGKAQAVFPGGVQILAGDNVTPPNERRVRWVRASDGALVADAFGAEDAFNDYAYLRALNPDGTHNNAQLNISAGKEGGSLIATVNTGKRSELISQFVPGNPAGLQAQSSFLRMASDSGPIRNPGTKCYAAFSSATGTIAANGSVTLGPFVLDEAPQLFMAVLATMYFGTSTHFLTYAVSWAGLGTPSFSIIVYNTNPSFTASASTVHVVAFYL